jgi:hypothetical protein
MSDMVGKKTSQNTQHWQTVQEYLEQKKHYIELASTRKATSFTKKGNN